MSIMTTDTARFIIAACALGLAWCLWKREVTCLWKPLRQRVAWRNRQRAYVATLVVTAAVLVILAVR